MPYRKLNTSAILLIVCLVLLISASYAWFAISRAPEITGMETNLGSNGSLEIAMLSADTYIDPSLIRSRVGDSAAIQAPTVSNLSWGNVIDLSDDSYGLHDITLMPARLNLSADADGGFFVKSNMLMMPSYSADGRMEKFEVDGESGGYLNGDFIYDTEKQYYGVRGIGTISNLHVQQVALTGARSAVRAQTTASNRQVVSLWNHWGDDLITILKEPYANGASHVSPDAVGTIAAMAEQLSVAYGYLDSALRHSLVGYAAAMVGEEAAFKSIRSVVENRSMPLSEIIQEISLEIPEELKNRVQEVEQTEEKLKQTALNSRLLAGRGKDIPWEEAQALLAVIIEPEEVFAGEHRLTAADAYAYLQQGDGDLLLSSKAGALGAIADYIGNYTAFFTVIREEDGSRGNVQVQSASTVPVPYLTLLALDLDGRQPAYSVGARVTLRDICGYAVDTAFRCNVSSDLLLQTEAALRVEEHAEYPVTQGGGSYIRFAPESLTAEQALFLMDGIRIGFLDHQGTLLAVAKLNSSSYTQTETGIQSPLYLYDFSVDSEGRLFIGDRRKEENAITSLAENIPTVITIVVWMDGDHVDNGMVAHKAERMEGTLNLQFASSADLFTPEQSIS